MIEVTIDSIRVSLMSQLRVVILKDPLSGRYLPIFIGPCEAEAIAVKLQNVSVERPLTHDLLKSVISELGGTVQHILVNDLRQDTFFAQIVVDQNGQTLTIDSRPSDALALAVRANVPVYAEEAVLDKAGIMLDEETGKPIMEEGTEAGGKEKGVSDEEMKTKLSAFYDFINTLDLDDFDKRKS